MLLADLGTGFIGCVLGLLCGQDTAITQIGLHKTDLLTYVTEKPRSLILLIIFFLSQTAQ